MTHQTGTGKYEQVLARCKNLKPVPTAVVHPCEESALSGAVEAANLGIIAPILVGPHDKIAAIASAAGIDVSRFQIVDAPHSNAAAVKAVELVRTAQAELLMKGSLHTDELMAAVVSREGGLRTGRRISDVFVMDIPTYHKVLIITDGAINISPTLEDKAEICQNAVDLAISLGLSKPKVAILAAVETITSRCRPRSTRRRFARWRSGDRSPVRSSTVHWHLTTQSARRPPEPKVFTLRLLVILTSFWHRTSKRETCLPSN